MLGWVVLIGLCFLIYLAFGWGALAAWIVVTMGYSFWKVKQEDNNEEWIKFTISAIENELQMPTRKSTQLALVYIMGLTGFAAPKDKYGWPNYIKPGVDFVKRGYGITEREELQNYLNELRDTLIRCKSHQKLPPIFSVLVSRLNEPITDEEFVTFKNVYNLITVSIIAGFLSDAEAMVEYMNFRNIKDYRTACQFLQNDKEGLKFLINKTNQIAARG
jgi:hypothetical protein